MSRAKKIIRNIIIIAILCCLTIVRSGLYLSPISAHEHSERSIHYGPSEVIHIQDFNKGKYILCKYDRWVSCNTVNKALFIFWRFGDQPTGFENDKTKMVDYTWHKSRPYCKLYGIINDDRVKEIKITLANGTVFSQTEFYDDLLLFSWEEKDNGNWDFKNIIGYDSDNNIIFKEG